MKIVASPMAALRAEAVRKVNERYNQIAMAETHRDAAHAWKRAMAAAVLSGAVAETEFAEEALARGQSVTEFADLVAGKPNATAQREASRQAELRAIAVATSPEDLPR